MKSVWQRWFGPLLLAGAMLPAAVAVVDVVGLKEGHAEEDVVDEATATRRRLLRSVPSDASVLINVPYRDLPSSPELVNLGKRSTRALERCLADNVDAGARARCAIVLEALGDRTALPTLQTALDDWDVTVRYRVVRALAAMPDRSSVEPLLKLYQRKDEEAFVREQVLRALGAQSDKRVVAVLRKEIARKPGEGEADVRAQAFDALWMHRHLLDRNTLAGDVAAALRSDNVSLVLSATYAASELRAPRLTTALVPLMESPNPEIANKAIHALGRIGDRTATKALLARLPEVRESRMLNNLAFALERLDRKAFYAEIAKTIEHKQAVIRLNSAFVLGDVGHGEGLGLLTRALGDASDFVRSSAVAAMGKLSLDGKAREDALAALAPLANDANLTLREEAIYALHALTPGGRADLIHDKLFRGLSPRKHAPAIRRAALALGKAGDARARDYLLDCALTGMCDVDVVGPVFTTPPRESDTGRIVLSWVRGNRAVSDLVATLRPAGASLLAMSALRDGWAYPSSMTSIDAIRLLGGLGDVSALDLLVQRTATEESWPRVNALVAAGRLGDPSAAPRLAGELDQLAAETLPDLARAMGVVREPPFQAKLGPLLDERSRTGAPEVAMCAAATRLAWDPDAGIFRLLDGLAAADSVERELAARYLLKSRDRRVTWALRRALAREERPAVRDRLRAILDERG